MAPPNGIDAACDCTSHASAIAKAGVKVVGRYYRWHSSHYPALTYAEARALTDAGLSIVALWEWVSDNIGGFSHKDGVDQGTSAFNQAVKTHQPPGTPIYFAVDFDASPGQVGGAVADFFHGVHDALGVLKVDYAVGVYGSGRTCAWLLSHGLVSHTWLANANGWAGADSFADWNIHQGHVDLKIVGLKAGHDGDYDSDVVNADAGLFRVPH